MNKFMKSGLALLLVLVLSVSLIPAVSFNASAATVDYVYSGDYIYNWGTRGEIATFLSPNAKEFYEDNNTSYSTLASYSGSSNVSSVPSSALYKELQSLMKGAHTYITSYNATKDLFQYTDCQDNGGKISSFYSGKSIGPSWDGSSWNREHTWPNSKGLGGSDENDLMMLRPTSMSENSSRGNTAYGKSNGYYNPNSESNGTYDLRGDVARIFLYVYVRWGNTNNAWGSGGVMENKTVLLEWMEADPVDTWELGRNDSVESITGTRNVFVDYPELAFLLFDEDIPENMTTPSGENSKSCNHNNFDSGVIVAATCTSKGYTLYTCQTAGCEYSKQTNVINATGHNYVSGTCTKCGEAEPVEPEKPTYVTSVTPGEAYKLGHYSTAKGTEYYFSGKMSGYYGATDTSYDNAVDVFVETTTGGYYIYFIDGNGQKQYINLVISGTYYNFTYSTTATSVYTWDADKNTFTTLLSGEVCYIGTFDTYVTMGVLRSSKAKDTDYIARFYTYSAGNTNPGGGNTPGGGDTPDAPCTHSYDTVVVLPTCTSAGYTTYICVFCADNYTGNTVAATGHSYVNDECTACGAVKNSSTSTTATISFTSTANRTSLTSSQQVWEQNGITVTNNKAGAASPVADYSNPARFYQGSEVIISYPGITKLEIDCTGLEAKYVGSWTTNAPTGATATNNNGIVTIVFATPVDSVTFASLAKQSRAYSITVYSGSGSGSGSTTPAACQHSDVTVNVVAPTCTSAGYTTTVCDRCGETSVTDHVAALGHNWLDATTEAPKTCTRCGETEGSKLPAGTPDGGDTPEGGDTPDSGDTPDGGNTPDSGDTPDGGNTPDGGETSDKDDTTAKDHSQCKANGFKSFWTSFLNFFRSIFSGKKKCVCGEFYS